MSATEWGIVITLSIVVPTSVCVLILRALWAIRDQLSTLTTQMSSTREGCVRSEADRKNLWARVDRHTDQIAENRREITAVEGRVAAVEGHLQ